MIYYYENNMVMDYPEGATPLEPDELDGLKYSHVETRDELGQLKQQNIQEGYNWLTRQRKYKKFLSEEFLKTLHERLFGSVWSWAGNFRHSDKNIGVDHLKISVELQNLLDDARYWIENITYNREEFAARFHHRLVKIHAFPNGNGWHARIMTDIILEKVLGMVPVNWGEKPLDKDGEHRNTYIKALRVADNNDCHLLIEFVSK